VPSIQFRAGGKALIDQMTEKTSSSTVEEGCLEWWQVPDRFRRAPMDQVECEEINSGGGGKLWN